MTARSRWSRSACRVAVLAGVAVLAAVGLVRPALAQTVEQGEAVVVAPGGRRLEAGGSATEFSLRLPAGAECPGDSAYEGWRINSYMVPTGVDITTLPYDGLGPTPAGLKDYGAFRQPLYDVETRPYVSALTAAVQERGEPGLIVDLPLFAFGVYSPQDIPPGRYHVGIACTLLNEVGRLWDAEIVVSEAVDDAPAQLQWQVVGVEPAAAGSGLPIALTAATAGVALMSMRARVRRRRAPRHASASRKGAR